MSDEQKQIEEMAKVIMQQQDCKGYEDNRGCYFGNGKGCEDCKIERHENAQIMADYLYNAGYRKIPEDAVVLTREEYNKLCQKIGNLQYDKDILKQLEEENTDLKYDKFELKNEISEKDNKIALLEETIDCIEFNVDFTRKETAEKFAERVKMAFYHEFDELIPSIMADKIDEICKEITEGKV